MKTSNEQIQQLLSEGITEARKRNFHVLEDSYCAVHLAKKCAELQEQNRRLLIQWRQDKQTHTIVGDHADAVFINEATGLPDILSGVEISQGAAKHNPEKDYDLNELGVG